MKSHFANENAPMLTRPTSVGYLIDEGAQIGTIDKVTIEERESRYSADGRRMVLNLGVTVGSKTDSITLSSVTTINWRSSSKFINLLERLGVLPDPGCDLDLQALEGMAVDLVTENVNRDGHIYTNIINIRKRSSGFNLQKTQQNL